jgi:[ribosomal protein S18]-alanine N-acetyltransferase
MSRWTIAPMSQADAEAIATWRYPGEYAFYDADFIPADLAELLDPQLRGDGLFAAHAPGGELEGFVELKPRDGGAVEIGLGLRPDLTGQGLGAAFTAAAIELARGRGAERITLAVAAFNLRATRVYERAGFIETGRHMRHIAGREWEFVDMELASEPGTGGA